MNEQLDKISGQFQFNPKSPWWRTLNNKVQQNQQAVQVSTAGWMQVEVTLCIHSHNQASIEFLMFLLQAMMDDKSEPLNYYAAYSEVKKLVI